MVLNRTGVVLSESGGALEKMLPFFKAGIGGPVAGGRQYVPWVHVDDVVGATIFALENEEVRTVNVTAPEPVTNKELSKALGRVLRRPAFAPVPALAVKTLYGEMAADRDDRPARAGPPHRARLRLQAAGPRVGRDATGR